MKLYADVRKLSAARLRDDLGLLPDVIVGSPPCQDASVANSRRTGLDGARTGLFLEFLRLVDECRPAFFCAENVPGLRTALDDPFAGKPFHLGPSGRATAYDRIGLLAQMAGYAVQSLVVGADDAGAPHRRKRAWIIGVRADAVAADLSRVGCGQGWAGRPGPGAPGQKGEQLARGAASAADAQRLELWEQPRGRGGQGGPGAPEPGEPCAPRSPADAASGGRWSAASLADESRGGGSGRPRSVSAGELARGSERPCGAAPRDPDLPGLAQREGLPGDARPELAALERAVGPAGLEWNGGPHGHLRVDDGLPSGMARKIIAAYGDAVVPQITEAIGRTMRSLLPGPTTVLDLFCGAAGGWSLGMTRAGYDVVAACEIDPWRRSVTARRWMQDHLFASRASA